jgi:hypothetical protein
MRTHKTHKVYLREKLNERKERPCLLLPRHQTALHLSSSDFTKSHLIWRISKQRIQHVILTAQFDPPAPSERRRRLLNLSRVSISDGRKKKTLRRPKFRDGQSFHVFEYLTRQSKQSCFALIFAQAAWQIYKCVTHACAAISSRTKASRQTDPHQSACRIADVEFAQLMRSCKPRGGSQFITWALDLGGFTAWNMHEHTYILFVQTRWNNEWTMACVLWGTFH